MTTSVPHDALLDSCQALYCRRCSRLPLFEAGLRFHLTELNYGVLLYRMHGTLVWSAAFANAATASAGTNTKPTVRTK